MQRSYVEICYVTKISHVTKFSVKYFLVIVVYYLCLLLNRIV